MNLGSLENLPLPKPHWMSQMSLDISPGQVVWPRVLVVLGLSMCFAPANVAAYLYTPVALRVISRMKTSVSSPAPTSSTGTLRASAVRRSKRSKWPSLTTR